MSYESQLRSALTAAKEGKDISREAGSGIWANYVRSTCYPVQPRNVEALDSEHKALIERLESIRALSKEEKNSLRSAKSVVGKAITNNVDVWKRNDDDTIECDDDGNPTPKGKSELQEAKSDYDRMKGFIEAAQKKWDSETRESFTADELERLWGAIAVLADSVNSARQQ
ncbi:hypothetical protein UFOVP729_9 [uncultured Caudovirales phage]|uniref:Uncharacterized protein n=1 Tax=uncultured Caudovirales phage TaxID=2100421 RepID=A0A6J5NPK7_9CAUD|nr:hypothetical protein UFOVP729_9 [uncultured Caudovirales phage]